MPFFLPDWALPSIGGFLLGVIIAWLWTQARQGRQSQDLRVRLAELEKEREATQEKLAWLEEAEAHLRETFAASASQALQANSSEFLKLAQERVDNLLNQVRGDWRTHKAELDGLVGPLDEGLSTLDQHIRELEQKREGAYQGLTEQLRQLSDTHARLQSSTDTLNQALKSSSVRGRWGEFQLRRVVEFAGMTRHVDFEEQPGTAGAQPDLLVHLPNGGLLPVDSKASLKAYLEAVEAPDEATRQAKLRKYVQALQSRMRELSRKSYWEQFHPAPEFVVMFVPNEAGLCAAFDCEPRLLDQAIEQRILITTPITLVALLKAVAYGWQQHQVAEHAHEIAQYSRELHRRMERFIQHLVDLGKRLNNCVDRYNVAVGSLENQVWPAFRRFEEMGIATEELAAPDRVEAHAFLPAAAQENPDGETT